MIAASHFYGHGVFLAAVFVGAVVLIVKVGGMFETDDAARITRQHERRQRRKARRGR